MTFKAQATQDNRQIIPEDWLLAVRRSRQPAPVKHCALALGVIALDMGLPLKWTRMREAFWNSLGASTEYEKLNGFRALHDLRAAGFVALKDDQAGKLIEVALTLPHAARRRPPSSNATV